MAKTFQVQYQVPGAATGKTVTMKVFKPDKSEDTSQTATLTEIGTTGRYAGTFVADAPDWSVQVEDNAGGKACKFFGKPDWDSHGIADLVATVQTVVEGITTAVASLTTKVEALTSPPMFG